MSPRLRHYANAASTVCLLAGIVLSHWVEPGVRIEARTMADGTPALHFLPSGPGPHPVALLAHGITASKETLFRFGEALAAAGYTCCAVDLPGHGCSRRSLSRAENALTLERAGRELGSVDVFLGHSMGAGAGAEAVVDGGLRPRLFIAVGAFPRLGNRGPPLLLLGGQLDELVPAGSLEAQTDAPVVLASGCDHALEPYDPRLVNAAVAATCATVGKTPPLAPTRWIWRLVGTAIGGLGALGLAILMPASFPQPGWLRGPLIALLFVLAVVLTTGTWLGAAPVLRRWPLQLGLMALVWLGLAGLGKLHIPRWSVAALVVVVALGCWMVGAHLLALLAGIGSLLLFAGALLAQLASRSGSRRDGDLAMAIFIGYAVGQCVPMPI